MAWQAAVPIGLNILGSILGGDPNKAERERAWQKELAEYKRAEIAMKARRAKGKIQYKTGLWGNVDAASAAMDVIQQKYNTLGDEFQKKDFEIYRKSVASEGMGAASGATGQSAKLATVRMKGAAGMQRAFLAQELMSKQFELGAEEKDVWRQWREANLQTYDDSEIGRLQSIGSAPSRPRGPSFVSRVAPVLGVLGDYFSNKYQPKQKTGRDGASSTTPAPQLPSSSSTGMGLAPNAADTLTPFQNITTGV